MTLITVTNGQGRTHITQDELKEKFVYRDGNLYWINPPARFNIEDPAGCVDNSNGRRILTINNRGYLVHRLVFLYHHGYLPNYIDHEDRNPLNNKIENLRPATKSQNNANLTKRNGFSSIYLGVFFDKRNNNWTAALSKNNKNIKRTYIKTEIEAALYYNKLAVMHHKEFANLNIIKP